MEVEKLLDRYEEFIKKENYKEGLKVLLKAVEIKPEGVWITTNISSCYHELREYDKSLEWAKKAYTMHPKDPLVRWDYAGALYSNNIYKEAIKVWKMIINRGVQNIGLVDCTEGIRWARSIYNDCFYRIGIAYYRLKNYNKAIEYYYKHLELRGKGIRSLYSKKEILRDLNKAKKALLL